ncbi:GNAT family N-acetyltransferase [Paenibacillus jilunlii]|uniref:Acetyltransferase n=1 Tax=Paenibacillus jilunlii TaxID=682956 RepID=A0A1G9YS29_9BACL|nr:GNAT family N-acetyltransferase [Paenibacillus jilunlii]KWX78873.1 acetyltransferase [Paenibacillus jilunlii]SDN11912.1 Predicted acetyltransferase [Paenibacillus jilunlii]
MEIRQLHSEEFEAGLSLSEYAFKYKVADEDRAEARQKFRHERVWGVFEDGVLGAQLTLLPLQVYIQGKVFPMGGIAGVSTWPENRRQGLVAKLLSHTLQTMNESGQTLSFLHPFLIPFYRKFGWEVYCEYKKYSIPVDKFPRKTEIQGSVKRDSAALEILEGLYSRFAAEYNGTLQRDQEWWKQRVLDADMHHCVFYSELGEPEGYVLYKIENNELVIDEFIFMNEQARRGLWTFLANHDSMVTGASLKLVPSDDILPYLLPDPRVAQENYPYFMARIVNARTFIENFTFRSHNSLESRTLYIEDEHAPWNSGLWQWSVTAEGTATLERLEGEKAAADLSCTIGTLTVMLLGYKRPVELAKYGQLTGGSADLDWLETVIPQAKTALFDFF